MNAKQIVSLVSWILAVAFLAIAGYGAYRWYFKRPPEVIYQNTYQNTTVMPGANQTVENNKAERQKVNGFSLGADTEKRVTASFIHLF